MKLTQAGQAARLPHGDELGRMTARFMGVVFFL
jgi:hypothetical protein